jgi:hypothetical protein
MALWQSGREEGCVRYSVLATDELRQLAQIPAHQRSLAAGPGLAQRLQVFATLSDDIRERPIADTVMSHRILLRSGG